MSVPKVTKPGVHRRRNALPPEIRIIDINTKKEVSVADQLTISRYETLSSTDYHLGVLPALRVVNQTTSHRGALGAIGGGIEAIGGGLWDATMYPARMLAGNASIRSSSPGSMNTQGENTSSIAMPQTLSEEPTHPSVLAHRMKVFIHSPYDCILATKPTISDHFTWLETHSKFESAWNLLNQYPEALGSRLDPDSESAPSTPSKTQGSFLDFFEDDAIQALDSNGRPNDSQVEKEKARIGEKWVQQLVATSDWVEAGRACGKVLQTSSSWERWVHTFARANKYDELAPFIPTEMLRPPIPSSVYELMLGHYIQEDIPRFRELLDHWPTELYTAETVVEAIQSRLRSMERERHVSADGDTDRDWRLLNEGMAKLDLAIGRPHDALGCYIRLQDADAAMGLISSLHLVGAVADDIPGFILLRVSKNAQRTASLSELASLTLEPIQLLVSEAHRGNVPPDTVISQLEEKYEVPNPYLYFYFRALWNGESAESLEDSPAPKRRTISARAKQAAEERFLVQEGKSLVSDHADVAVKLFAEYDRELLMQFLKSSATYTLSVASRICEQRAYIPELVYILAKEGRTAEALRLIIDSLDDVSQAIAFAKDQDDASLWDDLLDYAMNKPRFIRGLLEEVGTSIDPLKLVKRIPLGLEIEGLRDGLARMLKEYEVQESISGGVARVLRGEVHQALQERSQGTRRGVKVEVASASMKKRDREKHQQTQRNDGASSPTAGRKTPAFPHHHASASSPATSTFPGHCAACGAALNHRDSSTLYLLAFPCRHVFHVSCLLRYGKPADYEVPSHYTLFDTSGSEGAEIDGLLEDDAAMASLGLLDRTVGPKVDHAALLRGVVRDLGGCPLEEKLDEKG